MPTRPLTNVIGSVENVLRRLLREEILSHSAIEGYDEWVYLNIQDAATDASRVRGAGRRHAPAASRRRHGSASTADRSWRARQRWCADRVWT